MTRPRTWRWVLTLRLRSRTSWTSWRLRQTRRAWERETQRRQLLEQALDSSLLREKELGQEVLVQEHRLQEMAESRQFRQTGQLPPSLPSLPPASPLTPLEAFLRTPPG